MSGPARPRETVLIVDDSPATLGMLNETLEAAGYTVLVSQTGQAALDLVERVTPDIVLMDALMPGLDGFETCRLLKQKPGLSAMPIVFMTGLTETQDVLRGLEAGGVDYVTKPVKPDEVVARVGVHLASARMTRSAHLALDSAGRFLLAADRAGGIVWATPQAMRLIEASAGMSADRLPAAALAWLGKTGELSVAFGPPGSPRLLLSHVGQVGPDEILLRLAPDASEQAVVQTGLQVTAREAEVLLWVSRGKSNRDIAEILSLSPRTVNKHLEQIFHKLSVENRSSATALVMRALSNR